MFDKNALPSPAPDDAPLTRPAISTTSRYVFITFSELYSFRKVSRRGSGRRAFARVGSIVQNG
jgi:hypothetical protein